MAEKVQNLILLQRIACFLAGCISKQNFNIKSESINYTYQQFQKNTSEESSWYFLRAMYFLQA